MSEFELTYDKDPTSKSRLDRIDLDEVAKEHNTATD
jgi:hypothetical protein